MDSYTFGRNYRLKFVSNIFCSIANTLRYIRGKTLRLMQLIRKFENSIRTYCLSLQARAEPVTIHIMRVVPLDRFTIRIEFTVNRRTRCAYHIFSDTGSYADLFASFKRGDDVEITDELYYVVRDARSEWKQL